MQNNKMQLFLDLPYIKVHLALMNKLNAAVGDVPHGVRIIDFTPYREYRFQYPDRFQEPTKTNYCKNGVIHIGNETGRIWTIGAKSADHAIDAIMQMMQAGVQTASEQNWKVGQIINAHVVHLGMEHVHQVVPERKEEDIK